MPNIFVAHLRRGNTQDAIHHLRSIFLSQKKIKYMLTEYIKPAKPNIPRFSLKPNKASNIKPKMISSIKF